MIRWGGGKLEDEFWNFHEANPRVYELLCRFARLWLTRWGHGCSINFLFERVRWEIYMEVRDDAGFKLNNNFRAFYSRLIMDLEPDLAGFFRLRRQRIQSTFGPDNDSLPPGDHVA